MITYNAVIRACEKSTKPARALELLEETRPKGVKPNVITYSSVISACAKGKLPERAQKLLARQPCGERIHARANAPSQCLDPCLGEGPALRDRMGAPS